MSTAPVSLHVMNLPRFHAVREPARRADIEKHVRIDMLPCATADLPPALPPALLADADVPVTGWGAPVDKPQGP